MKTKLLSFICTFLILMGFLSLIDAQEFWGMTTNGGTNDTGIIFE